MGDLLHPPGTSHLQDLGRLPTWGTKPERTRPGVALWKPMGTVRNSLLIEAILDVDDASLRKSIMQTKVRLGLCTQGNTCLVKSKSFICVLSTHLKA